MQPDRRLQPPQPHRRDLILHKTQRLLAASKAKNTLRAYKSDWRHFTVWCEQQDMRPFPASAESVAMYIADMSGDYATSTIKRRLTAIRKAHKLADVSDPTASPMVAEVLDGIKREFGVLQAGKRPLRKKELLAMVDALTESLTDKRDRAILLLGFAGAFRRSELVGLNFSDLAFCDEGVVVTLRRSKTDQAGEGMVKGIPYGRHQDTCPVHAISVWLNDSGIRSGALFRPITKAGTIRNRRLSDRSVALIVKRIASRAGLDAENFAGHSLRSGLATEAASQGANERSIMKQGGWKSAMMARRYIRDGSLFRDNAADAVGL